MKLSEIKKPVTMRAGSDDTLVSVQGVLDILKAEGNNATGAIPGYVFPSDKVYAAAYTLKVAGVKVIRVRDFVTLISAIEEIAEIAKENYAV